MNATVDATPIPLVRASFVSLSQGVSQLGLIDGSGTSVLDVNNVAVNTNLCNGSLTAAVSVGGVAEQPDTAALPQQRNTSDGRVTLAGTAVLTLSLIIFGAALTVWIRRRKGIAR